MTTNVNVAQKAARRKLNLLQLAEEMGNVSKACKLMEYSRQQYYEIRRNYQTYGSVGQVAGLNMNPPAMDCDV